ncbi:MAG: sensor histidine kinase [Bdellovibrionia bacterium]
MRIFRKRLDLQAKVSLILGAVILPTFLIVTYAENRIAVPLLLEELKQLGMNSAKTLAAEIDRSRLLTASTPGVAVENAISDVISAHPDITRMDVITRDPLLKTLKVIASSVEEDPLSLPESVVESPSSEFVADLNSGGAWKIWVPIEHKSRDPHAPKKILGMVHLIVSTQSIERVTSTLRSLTAAGAAFSVVSLILLLSYFLRKTIANDRLLLQAESDNLELTERLQELQRQLMNSEKLAAMGQLTASFAHEMGTPLNAIGGHIQLLKEDLPPELGVRMSPRFEVVHGQLSKIEGIVKSFLQSTAKPTSQKQLVDLNQLVDRSLEILNPRVQSLGVQVKRDLDRTIGPIRAVPLDLEHILLNLFTNSLDSMKSKQKNRSKSSLSLEVKTSRFESTGKQWIDVAIYDTGEGIRKVDLKNVLKPFFTTKSPGEGTGLGLSISKEIAHKYGGDLFIESKEGVWTRITLRLPYPMNL